MPTRYGERGYGRYGDPEDDRTEDRYYERDAERSHGAEGGRPERGRDYGVSRRSSRYPAMRSGDYGRDYDARDLGPREYGSRYGSREYDTGEYGARYGREGLGGGYAGSVRRREGEDYGRVYGVRAYGRDSGRERERAYNRDDEGEGVRDYDTDYGRTTSRFYGRSGYEYGRDDYDERERGEYGRRAHADREDERGDGGRSWLDRAADEVRSWFGSDEPERGEDPRRARGRGQGRFRGRGPKNYRRSDERVREEVCDRLTDNEWLDASDVEVGVVAGEVSLTGTVDSRYAKRLAENIAESVSGVSNVQNNLRVQGYEAIRPDAAAALPAAGAADITATTDTTATPSPETDTGLSSSRAAGRS